MFVDIEEGKVTVKTKPIARVTQELLDRYDYSDVKGCPIFHALRNAGVAVFSVGGDRWIDCNGNLHPLPDIATKPVEEGGLRIPGGFARPFEFEVEI